MIAQDVERVLPEAVLPIYGGRFLGVRYTSLIPLLIEAVKDLDKQRVQRDVTAAQREAERDSAHCASLQEEMQGLWRRVDGLSQENESLRAMLSRVIPAADDRQ